MQFDGEIQYGLFFGSFFPFDKSIIFIVAIV